MRNAFIVGCGDIGRRIARILIGRGDWAVAGSVRSQEKADALAAEGIAPVVMNLDLPETIGHLPTAGATIFYLAPPPGGGVTDPRARRFCEAIARGEEPVSIVYLSTTAVYGDQGEGIVTEDTPAEPDSTRGKRRLDAEETFRAWGQDHRVPVVTLRVAGIYGPGRFPVVQLMQEQPVLREEEAKPSNRVHADDLAAICVAAAERGEDGDLFNVSDGRPGTITEYFDLAAQMLGYPPPRRVTLEEARETMSPLMISYVTEGKIVDNRRMLAKLGISLQYPTLRQGLEASLPEQLQLMAQRGIVPPGRKDAS